MKNILLILLFAIFGGLTISQSQAQRETVVTVPPGTYNFADIPLRSGTADNWIRYKPSLAGSVTIRGGVGSQVRNVQFIILDGFKIDGRLDPNWPAKSAGLSIASSNIVVANTEIAGPADIHTGFDISGQKNCDEATRFPTQSGGIGVAAGVSNVTFLNIVVHGFRSIGSIDGTNIKFEKSLFRNNFNGLGLRGGEIAIVDSVFWVHPNHLISLGGIRQLRFVNNLVVDSQDTIQAGPNWIGGETVHLVHNTFYIPRNKPCYGMSSPNFYNIKQAALARDNLYMTNPNNGYAVSDASVRLIQSDHNLFANYSNRPFEVLFYATSRRISMPEWQDRGQDQHSVQLRMPLFGDPPQYEDFDANQWGFRIPSTASEARSWFVLKSGSPGKNAASDGKDMGMLFDGQPATGRTAIPRPTAPTGFEIR